MLIKASDAKSWSICQRRAWYDNYPPAGLRTVEADPFEQMILEKGLVLESRYLEQFKAQGDVVEARSANHTQELMATGAPVIYQGIFETDEIIGKPDFLVRQPSGEYQPIDVKLAHSTDDKKEIQIQLGLYRRLLKTNLPALAYLGTGEVEEIGPEVDKKVDDFLVSMKAILSQTAAPSVRYSDSKCRACPYFGICTPAFEAKGELTLLYGVESRSAPGLEKQGFTNIEKLAAANPDSVTDVPYLKGPVNKKHVVFQAQAYLTGKFYQLGPINLPKGTWVHFDIEDNPLTQSGQKHVYLWGFLKPGYEASDFDHIWTDREDQDYEGWQGFLAKVESYKQRYSDLLLVHFSRHERTTIESYAKRYDMEQHPTVAWLRSEEGPLFDLQKPVLDSLVLPIAGYGLKSICKHPKLVNFQWQDAGSGSQWSVVQFQKFLEASSVDQKKAFKESILKYNHDDVRATRALEVWLRSLPTDQARVAINA